MLDSIVYEAARILCEATAPCMGWLIRRKGILISIIEGTKGYLAAILNGVHRGIFISVCEIAPLDGKQIDILTVNALSAAQHSIHPEMGSSYNISYNFLYISAIFYTGVLSSLGTTCLSNYAFSKIEASKLGVFGNPVIIVTTF